MNSNTTVTVCAGEFFKTIPVLIAAFALAVSGFACGGSDKDEDDDEQEANTMTDRAGNKYKTVTIGSQTWMAENMRYKGTDVRCLYKNNEYIEKYGCLYNWSDARKVCPDGWHLPAKKDFEDLLAYADAHRTSGSVFLSLIAKSDAWTDYANQGGDDFGFAALPTEQAFPDGSFSGGAGLAAYFWSSEEHIIDADGIDNGWRLRVNGVLTEVELMDKDVGDSVRCLKD